ncbi:MAG: TonB-dependent siderophore receptor, partial [Verrucomicrobium sp.]
TLLETPQAISVIPRAIFVDQGSKKLEEIIRNSAGVSTGGFFGEWDYYRIRGFEASYFSTYVDGLIAEDSPGEEPWGLERVEVVKGPASTLYGQGPLGGFVNVVSKRPQKEFFGEVEITGGSFDLYQAALDVNLPLTGSGAAVAPATGVLSGKSAKSVAPVVAASQDGGVYLRLNALYRNSGSFVDYAESERIFFAPSLTWEISPDTSLTILALYKEDTMDLAYALPARGTVLPNPNGRIPISRYIGNPALGNDEWERTIRLGYEFNHRFNDHLKIRQNFRYYWLDFTSTDLSYPQFLDTDNRTLALAGYRSYGEYEGLRVDTALDASFETGVVKHSLTLGVDYRYSETLFNSRDGDLIFLDVFKPNYSSLPNYKYGPQYSDRDEDSDLGFYIQEQAKIGNVALTLGGRFDHSMFDGNPGKYKDDSFTPKAGITWEFTPGVAAYANYSRSFTPQWSSTDASGQPVAPEEGENWEAGLKYSILDGKISGMLSVYQLTRENVATDNLSTPDPFDAIVTGEQRSRGFEFETAAELAPGLQFTTAYTYIDGEITEDNTYTPGTRLQGVPEHSVNAWLKYTVQSGALKGFGVGLGGRYFTSQAGDLGDTFSLPSYGIVDAALYYERDDFRVQVNFNNVFDKRHFVGSYSDVYVLPGAPFNVAASVSWKF